MQVSTDEDLVLVTVLDLLHAKQGWDGYTVVIYFDQGVMLWPVIGFGQINA